MTPADPFVNIEISHRNIDRWIIRTSILEAIRQEYPKLNGKLLDVGCGKMPYRQDILTQSGVSLYVGLDIEGALIYDESTRPDVTWDGTGMPFDNDEFDCVIATEVLEHVHDITQFLSEVKRVLKPGGIFFFTTPFIWPYHETPHDRQRWTSFGLVYHLEGSGFRSITLASRGNWHSSLAQMIGLWVARAPMPGLLRRVLRRPLFLIQRLLCRFDSDSENIENSMPRMTTGTALL